MLQQIQAAIRAGETTVLTEVLEDVTNARSGDLRRALRRRDKLVERVVKEAARYIGLAVAHLVNQLHPQMVVLGGGLIEALAEDMLGIIVATATAQAQSGTMNGVKIRASLLGDNAAITGGAILAQRLTK